MFKKSNNKNSFFIKNKKKLFQTLTILIVILIMGAGFYSLKQNNEVTQTKKRVEINNSEDFQESSLKHQIKEDFVLGNENAPITIIEYASLSCPHCANFYNNVFSQIEKDYINKGKVKFIYRDFPLNQSAMMASMISLCHAKNNNNDSNKYYKFIKTLFKTQDSWAFGDSFFEKLQSLAKLNGMTSKQFENCVNDKDLVDRILKNRLRASEELQVKSTPTLIMNGKIIGGYHNFKEFKKIIDEELS